MSDCTPTLPQDVITDVLKRLPAKSIGRFRCVSKPWRSLLSNPRFIKEHLNFHIRSDPDKFIVVDRSDRAPRVLTPNMENNSTERRYDWVCTKVISPLLCLNKQSKRVFVVGSCHGLVLLANDKRTMILMNPTTLEAVEIPKFGLSLDPFVGDEMLCGLGYDETNNDYKIVTFPHYDRDEQDYAETFADVYSVRTKTWKRLAKSRYSLPYITAGVLANGCLHWIAKDTKTAGHPLVIAAFDLAREEFKEVPPPRDINISSARLTVLGGCFACFDNALGFNGSSVMNFWVMYDYGEQESWIQFNISDCKCICYLYRIVGLLRDDELVMVDNRKRLVMYSLSSRVLRDMNIVGAPYRFGYQVMTFKESLLSPNYISG
ncbi:OLC1v1030382C1 [Oldenlandia corymbosa var. corymbosa]|uniref:OLC1v1030382C1 n=1 Tax=Oldenlandia corymbosa var. corymbosa TaxID=529605 RepID=A0AAV1CG15_OLDCO|nr:OLC1v1030382C1 [Oldenlandia corymbosa var. corymbosa]